MKNSFTSLAAIKSGTHLNPMQGKETYPSLQSQLRINHFNSIFNLVYQNQLLSISFLLTVIFSPFNPYIVTFPVVHFSWFFFNEKSTCFIHKYNIFFNSIYFKAILSQHVLMLNELFSALDATWVNKQVSDCTSKQAVCTKRSRDQCFLQTMSWNPADAKSGQST